VFCGTCGRRFFGRGTNCPKCAEREAEQRTAAQPVIHCKRCGKEVRGQSGDVCATCEMVAQREADAKHKRRQRAEREAVQKHGGGRPWRYR
jgi:hypothetical protein